MKFRRRVLALVGCLAVTLLLACDDSGEEKKNPPNTPDDHGALVDIQKLVQDPQTGGIYPVNQALIIFRDTATEQAIEKAIAEVQGEQAGYLDVGGLGLYQVQLQTSTIEELDQAIAVLKSNADVETVLKNHVSLTQDTSAKGYDTFSDAVSADYQAHYKNLQLEEAWTAMDKAFAAASKTPNLVKISAVDTGVYREHSDLKNDPSKEYQIGGNAADDAHSHGTGLSGIIAAHNNGEGMNGILTGMAHPRFQLNMNCSGTKEQGPCYAGTAPERGVDFNDLFMVLLNTKISAEWDEAHIVLLALGWEKQVVGESVFAVISDLFSRMFRKNENVLFVCAAGNGNIDASEFAPGGFVDDTITNRLVVGATMGATDTATAEYPEGGGSNYGATVNIAAPGGHQEIFTTLLGPDGAASGGAFGGGAGDDLPLLWWGPLGGTSVACAIVASIAALILSIDIMLVPAQVIGIIIATGIMVDQGKLSEFDTKRVNAYNAVSEVLGSSDLQPSTTIEGFPQTVTVGDSFDVYLKANAQEGYTLENVILRGTDGEGASPFEQSWHPGTSAFSQTVTLDTSDWAPGECELLFSAQDNEGHKGQFVLPFEIVALEKPLAEIILPSVATGTVFNTYEEFQVKGEGTPPAERTIESWRWDMKDGRIIDVPFSAHTYEAAGDYEISLVVTDSAGVESDPATVLVTVEYNPTVTLTSPNTFDSLPIGSEVVLEWTTTGASPDDFVVLSAKRDNTSGLTAPDDVHWKIFATPQGDEKHLNDGEQTIVLSSSLHSSNDWRFYVHLDSLTSNVFDGSDETMVISAAGLGTNPRFVDQGDGTVKDTQTGLVWLQDPACIQPTSWADALQAVAGLYGDGGSGRCGLSDYSVPGSWRLPNRHELFSLLDFSRPQVATAMPDGHPFRPFFNGGDFWTSTTVASATDSAWYVDMMGNGVWTAEKTTNVGVWPVQEGSFNLPKTGQTQSFHAGDDGDLQKGNTWPSPRFEDQQDGTVLDKLTGLYWLKDVGCSLNLAKSADSFEDGVCGLSDGSAQGDWRYPTIDELETLTHKGFDQPPLPDADGTGQWSEGNPFSGVKSDFADKGCYWSATPVTGWAGYRWLIKFATGGTVSTEYDYSGANSACIVWPVRD